MKMKAIKNYEGFFDISKSGEVKSLERFRIGSKLGKLVRVPERIMKDRLDRKGYRTISLRKDGTIKHFLVHRLVAETYIPNPLNLPQVNHIDGVKSNCNDWNLEWMTCSDNHKHAFKLGLKMPMKEMDNGMCKITNEQLTELLDKYSSGNYKQIELAKEYNCTQAHISYLINNKRR